MQPTDPMECFGAARWAARPSRRALLRGLATSTLVAGLSGCDTGLLSGTGDARADQRGRAALLLPLTGSRAALGQTLRGAATLGGTTVGLEAEVEILDSGDSPQAAVRAAEAAIEQGAKMLVGPLFSDQARAVASAVGNRIPVVSLSNDDTLTDAGAFVYGVTPQHSAQAVFSYAAGQGIRDIAMAVPSGEFGARSVAGAQAVAKALGLALREPATTPDALAATLSDGPGAVYLPSAGGELAAFSRVAAARKVQILGSVQWSAIDLRRSAALQGAWFASPEPLRFAPFTRALEEKGITAGIVSGLVFDAVEMARLLGRIGQQTRRGLLRREGFSGVLGPYKFLKDGRTQRGLAVLAVEGGDVRVLGATSI